MQVAAHFLVINGNVAAGLVGHMHFVFLLNKPADGSSHRDYIIVGMRRKHDDALWERESALRTRSIVGVWLAAWPSRDGVLQFVEHLDIDQRRRAEFLHPMHHSMFGIVPGGEFQQRFARSLA